LRGGTNGTAVEAGPQTSVGEQHTREGGKKGHEAAQNQTGRRLRDGKRRIFVRIDSVLKTIKAV